MSNRINIGDERIDEERVESSEIEFYAQANMELVS